MISIPTLILAVFLFAVCGFGYRAWTRKRWRQHLLECALTEAELASIIEQVPLVAKMPLALRNKLEGKICLFLDQVAFQGCNGLEVVEAMRLSIAAQACLIVVNTDAWYENLTTVLIYPSAFKSVNATVHGFVVTERETIRTGESWSRGPVILSWAHSAQGALNTDDGHNVVLHEFAHQFDDRSGRTDGVPVLNFGQSHAEWAKVFLDAFARHTDLTAKGAKTVIDPYGATGHEEFFATSVEVFFEKPVQLHRDEPAMYEQLATLFALDPSTWG
jgi:Mlc titration factor MtfA (ptsG expression regulator)